MCNEPPTHNDLPRSEFGKDKPQYTDNLPESVETHRLPLLGLKTQAQWIVTLQLGLLMLEWWSSLDIGGSLPPSLE